MGKWSSCDKCKKDIPYKEDCKTLKRHKTHSQYETYTLCNDCYEESFLKIIDEERQKRREAYQEEELQKWLQATNFNTRSNVSIKAPTAADTHDEEGNPFSIGFSWIDYSNEEVYILKSLQNGKAEWINWNDF